MIPCWQIIKCNIIDKFDCEAYAQAEKPCWTYNHKNNFCAFLECNKCEVYTSFQDFTTVKRAIRNLNTEQDGLNN